MTITDPFTYSNGNLTTVASANWRTVAGAYGGITMESPVVSGNKIVPPVDGNAGVGIHKTLMSTNDQSAKATVQEGGFTAGDVWVTEVGVRCSATYSGYVFAFFASAGTPIMQIDRVDDAGGGVFTQTTIAGPSAYTPGGVGTSHTIEIRAVGNTITALLDGVQVFSVTDTNHPTDKAAFFIAGDISGTAPTLDDFIFGDFVPPAAPAVLATPITFPVPAVFAPYTEFIGEIGGNTSNTSGTTLAITTTRDVEVGDFILIGVAADNSGTSGAARTVTCADNSAQPGTANSYSSTQINRTAASAANDGSTGTILRSNVTRKVPAGSTITITFSGAVVAKAASAACFRNAFGPNISSVTATGATTSTSVAPIPTAAGQLVFCVTAVEGGTADTFTEDADTLNGSWVSLTRRGAGTTTSGQTVNCAFKIVNASGTQTYNPTLGTARDWAQIGQAFPFNVTVPAPRPGSPLLTPISFPSASISTGPPTTVATAPLLSTPISMAAPTLISSPTATPAVLATPITFPAPIISISRTATPVVLPTPITFPAPAIVSSPTATPPVLPTPITFPAPLISVSRTATPAVIPTPITFPAPSIAIGQIAPAPVVTTPITFPTPVKISSPTASAPRVLTPITFPTPTTVTTVHVFSENFNRANGNLGSPWVDDSFLGGTDPPIKVISNVGSTDNSTGFFVSIVFHGLNISSGEWQIDCDCTAPLISGDGGVTIGILSSTDHTGYGFFVGNAVHVQRFFADGSFDHPTNVGRPNEHDPGVQTDHITMTRASNGDIQMYLAGAPFGNTNDVSLTGNGDMIVVTLFNTTSPTNETSIDNLVFQDFIGAVPVTATAPRVLTPITFPAPSMVVSSTATPPVVATTITMGSPAITSSPTANPAVLLTPITFPLQTIVSSPVASPPVLSTPITFPSALVTVSRTATPPVILTPISMAVPTVVISVTVPIAVIATPITFPLQTLVISATVSAPRVLLPITFAAPSITAGGSATAQAPLLSTPVTFPAQAIVISVTVTAPVLQTPITLPAPIVTVSRTAGAPLISTPVTFPAPSVSVSSGATATPPVIGTPITFPAMTVGISSVVPAVVVLTPITMPAPSASGGTSATALAPRILTPITFPSSVVAVLTFAPGPRVLLPLTFPVVSLHADQKVPAPRLLLTVVFPSPHADTGVFTVVVPVQRMSNQMSGTTPSTRRMSSSIFPTDPFTGH